MPKRLPVDGEIRTIRDIRTCHEGEWLLIRILDQSSTRNDARGQLLARGTSRLAMYKADSEIRKLDSSIFTTVVMGGAGFEDGEKFRQEIAKIKADGSWVSVNAW